MCPQVAVVARWSAGRGGAAQWDVGRVVVVVVVVVVVAMAVVVV